MNEKNEWTLERLQRLRDDRIQESDQLEFKGAKLLTSNKDNRALPVTKFVSGMANAGGGIVIFGLDETEDGHFAGEIQGLTNKDCSKETLDDLIGMIRPKITGYKIEPVLVSDDPEPKFVFVVIVPESTTAHQATDFRYYRRRNFKTEPIADYEIRELMNRKIHPDLEVSFRIIKEYQKHTTVKHDKGYAETVWAESILSISLHVGVTNLGLIMAQHINLSLIVRPEIFVFLQTPFVRISQTDDGGNIFSLRNVNSNLYEPVSPKSSFTWILPIKTNFDLAIGEFTWFLFVDSAEYKTGSVELNTLTVIERRP